jgi:hypothetical protein
MFKRKAAQSIVLTRNSAKILHAFNIRIPYTRLVVYTLNPESTEGIYMPGIDGIAEEDMESPKPRSFFSRIGGVYASPGAAFAEIGAAPRVLGPMFIMILIGLVAGFLLLQFLDRDAMTSDLLQQAQAAQQGGSQAQLEQARPFLGIIVAVQVVFAMMLGGLINALAVAGYGKLFSVFVNAKNTFKALFSASLYAIIAVSTIKYAALVFVAFLKRPFHADLATLNFAVASNLGSLISNLLGADVLPKYLTALLSYVDFFAIWMIALLAIGFAAVSKRLSTKTAATWISVAYAIIALLGAIFLARRI